MTAQVLKDKLQDTGIVPCICFFQSTDSTNIRAKEAAQNGAEHGTLVVADMQTAGKGRRGRAWDSPQGKNIYFTLILKPEFTPDKASMLTLVMALAVAKGMDAVVKTADKEECNGEVPDGVQSREGALSYPRIKWPNDLVMNGKKVCGILTELGLKGNAIDHVLIGVGINVYEQEFAPELADKASSLETEWGMKVSRPDLLAAILDEFWKAYELFCEKEDLSLLAEAYNQRLINKDRDVCVLDPKGEYTGRAKGITTTGELRVELQDGREELVYAGEVSVRGIYGYV